MTSVLPPHIHNHTFELTLALYRVTDFFPKEEPLRNHIREAANKTFQSIMEYGNQVPGAIPQGAISLISTLKNFLQLSRSLQFVKSANIMVLEREYDILLSFFIQQGIADQEQKEKNAIMYEPRGKEFFIEEKQIMRSAPEPSHDSNKKKHDNEDELLDERKKKILDFLKQVSQAKVSDFQTLFPNLGIKTIQRNLQDLVESDILKKEGDKRWTIYTFKNVQ